VRSIEGNGSACKTVDTAVDILLANLSSEDLDELRQLPEDRLIDTHFGLGMYVRNRFALWQNAELVQDACGGDYPMHEDKVSAVIAKALWERLKV
jgi:hypothetical protein